MVNQSTCPICLNAYTSSPPLVQVTGGDRWRVDCQVCGTFDVSGSLLAGDLDAMNLKLTVIKRAVLSHWVRRTGAQTGQPPFLSSYAFEAILRKPRLPAPSEQVTNAIRFIGDEVARTGAKVVGLQPSLYARIGAANPEMAGDLVKQLHERGLVLGMETRSIGEPTDFMRADLSIDGWALYEAELKGKFAGRYGFLAMQFHDPALDRFVADVLKPCVKEGTKLDLVDMRDVARAGIIDNIMREQIRDAAFVIADLTHDNFGAYWEAGYAEGLGKPVIYICEKSKFDKAKTHFDTSHSTTVMWEAANEDNFKMEIVATLRRSLNLFPS